MPLYHAGQGGFLSGLLEVRLSLTNLSATRKLTYRGWAVNRRSFGNYETESPGRRSLV